MDYCAVCVKSPARTVFSCEHSTAVTLGLALPLTRTLREGETPEPFRAPVCDGCYLIAMSEALARFGLPRATPPAPRDPPTPAPAAPVVEGKPL
jgi:hypothetical protein